MAYFLVCMCTKAVILKHLDFSREEVAVMKLKGFFFHSNDICRFFTCTRFLNRFAKSPSGIMFTSTQSSIKRSVYTSNCCGDFCGDLASLRKVLLVNLEFNHYYKKILECDWFLALPFCHQIGARAAKMSSNKIHVLPMCAFSIWFLFVFLKPSISKNASSKFFL